MDCIVFAESESEFTVEFLVQINAETEKAFQLFCGESAVTNVKIPVKKGMTDWIDYTK